MVRLIVKAPITFVYSIICKGFFKLVRPYTFSKKILGWVIYYTYHILFFCTPPYSYMTRGGLCGGLWGGLPLA
jgi:hypothetical protein